MIGEDAEIEAFGLCDHAGVGQKIDDEPFGESNLSIGVGPESAGDIVTYGGHAVFAESMERSGREIAALGIAVLEPEADLDDAEAAVHRLF